MDPIRSRLPRSLGRAERLQNLSTPSRPSSLHAFAFVIARLANVPERRDPRYFRWLCCSPPLQVLGYFHTSTAQTVSDECVRPSVTWPVMERATDFMRHIAASSIKLVHILCGRLWIWAHCGTVNSWPGNSGCPCSRGFIESSSAIELKSSFTMLHPQSSVCIVMNDSP